MSIGQEDFEIDQAGRKKIPNKCFGGSYEIGRVTKIDMTSMTTFVIRKALSF